MTSDYVSGQAVAAMRVLGLTPEYFESSEDVGAAFDKIKRVAIQDWESSRQMSQSTNEEYMMRTKILAALAESVLMDFMPRENLENREIRAEELRPGMFARERDHTVVIVRVEKLKSGDSIYSPNYFRITSIRADANSVGALGSYSSGIQGGQIFLASKGVSDIVNPPLEDKAERGTK